MCSCGAVLLSLGGWQSRLQRNNKFLTSLILLCVANLMSTSGYDGELFMPGLSSRRT